jgi:APA family basic amino acid/polyamine antiporter
MRFTHKEVPRGFRVPLGPWVIPPIGAMLCLLLIITSSRETGIRLVVWMAIGQIIYFTYGYWHSKLRFPKEIDSTMAMINLVIKKDNKPTANEYVREMPVFQVEKS